MNKNPQILNELSELAPTLAQAIPAPVFVVPDGYFDQLAGDIMLKISEESSVLPGTKETGFTIPEGYFDNLAGSIMGRIKTEDISGAREEIGILSPTLAGISREMPFAFPRSYFDQLAERITDSKEEAKVIQMAPRKTRVISRWMKMAAAACITGLLALGVYQFANRGSSSPAVTGGTQIAKTYIPTPEQVKDFDLDKELKKLSGDDITNYLCETGAIACNQPKNDELNKKISEISDEDVDAYLDGIN